VHPTLHTLHFGLQPQGHQSSQEHLPFSPIKGKCLPLLSPPNVSTLPPPEMGTNARVPTPAWCLSALQDFQLHEGLDRVCVLFVSHSTLIQNVSGCIEQSPHF
jgi:hypothetical protein